MEETLNNNEFDQQVLSVHEWSYSQAWMGLCVTLVRSEASLKIQVNSPMRLRLKIRHGDKQTWPRYEACASNPMHEVSVYWHWWKNKPEAKKTVCLSHAGALMCRPWLFPPRFLQAVRHSLTGPLQMILLGCWHKVCAFQHLITTCWKLYGPSKTRALQAV